MLNQVIRDWMLCHAKPAAETTAESYSAGQTASEFLGGVPRVRLTELRHGSDHRERDC